MVAVGKFVQYRIVDGAALRSRAAVVLRVINENTVDLFLLPETSTEITSPPALATLFQSNILQGLRINGDGLDTAGTWRFPRQELI